jgi:hypothetical protein
MMKFTGSCLCEAVHYAIEAQVKKFYFCHCKQCRKLTGSAHAANILTEPAPIRWLSGENRVVRYDAPAGREFTHVFCQDCGSGLPFMNVSKSTLFIPAGSLDTDVSLSVTRNIFWGEAPQWYETGLTAKRCSAFPE